MLRWLGVLLALLLLAAGGAYYFAGRGAPPSITIEKPDRAIGQSGMLQVTAGAPRSRFATLAIALEQNGKSIPLFALDAPQPVSRSQIDADHLRISREIGKRVLPDLQSGAARIVVTASRKTFLNLRTLTSTASRDVQVRLEPPRIAVASTHHYINHGGSEMVVYRATPPDVWSGVRVGENEYAGFPAAGAGVAAADPSLKVAFFALMHDQDLNAPIHLLARDDAGNEATAEFIEKVFEKPFRKSRIEIDDRFMQRVVPEIAAHAPELKMQPPSGDLLPAFLKINGELRQMNAERIAAAMTASAAEKLWQGPFVQLGNSQVEASFADQRTYLYKGKEIDRQVHLGFDLAVTANVPLVAANAGRVIYAEWLGIYGNCVIIDHGLGVGSLYGHLSSIGVRAGDRVTKGQQIGRSGMTGLAGGDHLHFTMLVGGRPVSPVEWWDPHWIEDRVDRKLREVS